MTQAFDELRSSISTLLQAYDDVPQQLTELAVFLGTAAQDSKNQASVTAARTSAAKRESQEIESFRLSSKMCRMIIDGVSVLEIARLHQKSTTAVTQRVRTLGYKLYYRVERSGLGLSKEPFKYATFHGVRDSAAEWTWVLHLLDKEIELRAKGQPFWQEVWKAPAWNEASEPSTDPVE